MPASRALRLTALVLAALFGGSAWATTPAVVVDVETGRVLHAERATDPWYPASVTKLMTAYVALSLVRDGDIEMDRLLTVSEQAAALPPSKMGFKPGTQIRLDNALKMIMVKSANDVAATIAENLGGSVEGFAALMNQTALRLGMRESRFVNPHGLPDDRQQTSARDMAVLGRALLRDFPDQQDLFQIGAIQIGRRIMRNHNGLIGRYAGADGMKTGFICASGFNVVASAQRGNRRLIVVVLGSPSANERTLRAATLFDYGFETSGLLNPQLDQLPRSMQTMPTNMRPVICDRRGPVPGEDDSGPVTASAGEASDNTNPLSLFKTPNVLAFAGGPDASTRRPTLGPRGPVQPVQVWVGLNPPEPSAAAQADEEATANKAKARKTLKIKPLARNAAPSTEPADADDKTAKKSDKAAAKKAAKPAESEKAAPAKTRAPQSAKEEPPAPKRKPVAASRESSKAN